MGPPPCLTPPLSWGGDCFAHLPPNCSAHIPTVLCNVFDCVALLVCVSFTTRQTESKMNKQTRAQFGTLLAWIATLVAWMHASDIFQYLKDENTSERVYSMYMKYMFRSTHAAYPTALYGTLTGMLFSRHIAAAGFMLLLTSHVVDGVTIPVPMFVSSLLFVASCFFTEE